MRAPGNAFEALDAYTLITAWIRKSTMEILAQRAQDINPTGPRTNFSASYEATTSQPQPPVRVRRDFESTFVVIPNTKHGFALHPDLDTMDGQAAFSKALSQTCVFLEKHLKGAR